MLKEENISRKDALSKAGKYALFTAAATILVLSPKTAMATSPITPPGDGWGLPGPVAPPGGGNGKKQKSPWGNDGLAKPPGEGSSKSPWK
jgi:hypothetical protein